MRNVILFITVLVFGYANATAKTTEDNVATSNAYRYNNSFIFVENNITFSVFPDGEFDFYIGNYVNGLRNKITFNSGYDYSPYAQYDDYGAVIQVENIPIYYDYYGRVSQIGDVHISYRNGRVYRLGGMNVFYTPSGLYDYHTGYINVYNRYYVYRPFHRFFVRPALGFSFVFNTPYRRYYRPIRYTYYRPYRYNHRKAYAKVGRAHRYSQPRRERATIYRNDKRVSVRKNTSRDNRALANTRSYTNRNAVRNNTSGVGQRNKVGINSTRRTVSSTTIRKSNHTNGRTVTKRQVTTTPRSKTVTRTTTSYQKPTNNRTAGNRVAPSRSTKTKTVSSRTSRNNVSTRSSNRKFTSKSPSSTQKVFNQRTTSRSSVSKAPSRSRTASTRSTSRQSVRKAPATRSNTTKSTASRSSSRRY